MRAFAVDVFRSILVLAGLLSAGSAAAPKEHHSLAWELAHGRTDYEASSPAPIIPVADPSKMKRRIETAVREDLRDPESARFEWPYGFRRGTYKSRSGASSEGWITCGTVNAKNAYGGYVGREAVAAVVSGQSVINVVFDEPTDDGSQWVAYQCDNLNMHVL